MPERMAGALLAVGVLGLVLTGLGALSAPAWAWLALVGAGLGYSLAWRAAGVRRVSAKERRRNEVRLRNAERRERRLLKVVARIERRVKQTLAEVREHPDLAWGEKVAAAVRALQEGHAVHAKILEQNKFISGQTAKQLGALMGASDEES